MFAFWESQSLRPSHFLRLPPRSLSQPTPGPSVRPKFKADSLLGTAAAHTHAPQPQPQMRRYKGNAAADF